MKQNCDTTSHERPLWAPWRLKYILGDKSEGCFLCGKAAAPESEDLQNNVIARGKTFYVLLNTFPYNSGHALVAPYRHVADVDDLTEEETLEMMAMVVKIKKAMKKVMNPDAFNFGFNLGEAAGAGLAEHLHGHIVPRWHGDTNFMPVLTDIRVMPQALEETTELLRQAWLELE